MQILDAPRWNEELALLNARIGARRQVNVIVIAVNTADSAYIHALEELWLGGKKNDCVIICGVTQYPLIEWVRVMSWTKREDLKITLRDGIQEMKTLHERQRILQFIEREIGEKFVRTPMKDFEYLMAGFQPGPTTLALLLILGIGGSFGLAFYFLNNDPFGHTRHGFSRW